MTGTSERIQRFVTSPLREGLSWDETWKEADQGLIACWECGRRTKKNHPELADAALRGELPALPFKGGFKKKPKKMVRKWGALHYFAMWQGLRGENLDIGFADEIPIVCSKLGIKVTFTFDREKYLADTGDDDESDDD
jgi:hypothetical protein